MVKRRSKTTANELINMWLKPIHGVTIEEVIKEYPEWKYPEGDSREFYKKYPVTQEQHDEWYANVIQIIMREYGWNKKNAERQFAMPYLNISPMIIERSTLNDYDKQ